MDDAEVARTGTLYRLYLDLLVHVQCTDVHLQRPRPAAGSTCCSTTPIRCAGRSGSTTTTSRPARPASGGSSPRCRPTRVFRTGLRISGVLHPRRHWRCPDHPLRALMAGSSGCSRCRCRSPPAAPSAAGPRPALRHHGGDRDGARGSRQSAGMRAAFWCSIRRARPAGRPVRGLSGLGLPMGGKSVARSGPSAGPAAE